MVVCNPFPMPTSKVLGILSTPCKSMHLCTNLSSPEKNEMRMLRMIPREF